MDEDPVNIRRREFELLRKEVNDLKVSLTEDEFSDANKRILLHKVARAMGLDSE